VLTARPRATARDALARAASELRGAQPPTPSSTTPFCFTLSNPYVCGANACVFYSSYNNPLARADGQSGTAQLRLTAIWLDTTQKILYWQRDTDASASISAPGPTCPDKTIILARNVVNAAPGVNVPVFTYYFSPTSGTSYVPDNLTSTNAAKLVAVQIRLVVDANLAHTPSYVDLKTTVRPRNAIAQ